MREIFTDCEKKASGFYLPKVKGDLAILAVMKHADFAARLQEACRDCHAPPTMAALGRWLGVSTTMAWNYTSGEKLPSMEKALEMAAKLGVCVEWLLTGRGPKHPPPPPDAVLDVSDLPAAQREGLRALVDSLRVRDKSAAA